MSTIEPERQETPDDSAPEIKNSGRSLNFIEQIVEELQPIEERSCEKKA